MLRNRSVPADVVLPHVYYRNLTDAMAWLSKTFGFVVHYQSGDPTSPDGAQIYLGQAVVMLGRVRSDRAVPAQVGHGTQMLTVFLEDVDAHHDRARAAGARIVEELHETAYGERQYGAEDLDGHRWLFSCHARDVSPEEWGARIVNRFHGREMTDRSPPPE